MISQLRTYFVGNSVTDTINQAGLDALAESNGGDLLWGRHMIPGASLSWIWEHPNNGFQQEPYGYYPNALDNYQWDVLSLQPFDRPILWNHEGNEEGDLLMASNFINRALRNSPDLQVYLYQRWPRKPDSSTAPTAADWNTLWQASYGADTAWNNNESRSYFERLQTRLQESIPNLKPIQIVPVGDVFFALNQKMQSGQVPGYSSIWDLYYDHIHLNNVGSFIVGSTYYATLYGADLTTLPVPAQYQPSNPDRDRPISSELEAIIEQTIQQVTGIAPPPLPTIAIADVNLLEGQTAQITVSLSAASQQPVTVSYRTENGTAEAGSDYTAQSGILTFAPGQTRQTIALATLSDSATEPAETLTLILSNPVNAAIADAEARVTLEDVSPTVPKVTIADGAALEGRDATAVIAVNLSAASSQTVTVNYSTSNGTAEAGSDYTAQSGILTFAPGQTRQTIALTILDDNLPEADETFALTLSNPSNATILEGEAIVTLTDTLQSAVSTTLPEGVDRLLLTGNADINGTGNAANNVLTANGGNNQLQGREGNDLLLGLAGVDRLLGEAGIDTLRGGAGNDFLTGGLNFDRFVFNSSLPFGLASLGLDTLTDFTPGVDRIGLNKSTFTRLQSKAGRGFQLREEFAIVTSDRAAATQSALIVYSRGSGSLFYNENGDAAGFGNGGKFAILQGAPAIRGSDFAILA